MPEAAGRRLVVVGSLNADLTVRTERFPAPGETLTGGDLTTSPGGKGSNQAAAAALLGAEVALVGRVGDDAHGAFLLERARAAGVDTTHVGRLGDIATGTAVITVDARGENTIIVSPGANGRLADGDVTEAAAAYEGAAVCCLCFEVPAEVVLAAARRASDMALRVVLNPSPFRAIEQDLLALTTVLVVNEHELALAAGSTDADLPWSAAADALRGRGPEHLVVTLGAEGAVVVDLASAADPVTLPSPKVRAVDTTGCGDAFLGALAAGLAAGDDLVDAARRAVRVGAYAATKEGAQASYPTAEALAAMFDGS